MGKIGHRAEVAFLELAQAREAVTEEVGFEARDRGVTGPSDIGDGDRRGLGGVPDLISHS